MIPSTHPDWIVTVAFYTALHAIDALLAADGNTITSHDARNDVLMRTNRYQAINKAYRPLYMLSRTIRYMADPSSWVPVETIEANVFERYLYRIEKSAFNLLKADISTGKITVQQSEQS